jgi:very-short-patch-repair endonuclease
MNNLKSVVLETFFKNGKFQFNKLRSKANAHLVQLCIQETQFLPEDTKTPQRIWHIANDMLDVARCIGGNPKTHFRSFNDGYGPCCGEENRFNCPCWNTAKESSSRTMKKTNESGKIKKAVQEKYGVDHCTQIPGVKEKISLKKKEGGTEWHKNLVASNLKRYGVEHAMQNADIKKKFVDTNLERYGVENAMQSKMVQQKAKDTNLERYGVENPMQSKMVQQKAKDTNLERYGVENVMQNIEIRRSVSAHNQIQGIEDHDDFFDKVHSIDWWKNTSIREIHELLKKHLKSESRRAYYLNKNGMAPLPKGTSLPHQIILDRLTELNVEYVVNTRKVIAPLELDVYIPSYNLAIEINGVYWHSENAGGKDRNYHLQKTLDCEAKGIDLLHFWDYEVIGNTDIVLSMIQMKLGISDGVLVIPARKCQIRPVSPSEAKEFVDKSHLQGSIQSSIRHGLYFESELVSCMLVSKPRYNKKFDLEILRFCTKPGVRIQGGFSKLVHSLGETQSILSYADRRYSTGNVYASSGWTLVNKTKPSYYYTKDFLEFAHRSKFQKHKLSGLLEEFDSNLTEWENMIINGYDRIWDCGTLAFSYKV